VAQYPDDDGNAVYGFSFGCLLGLGIWLALGALMGRRGLGPMVTVDREPSSGRLEGA
jgi:hypothetical protein